MKVVQLNLQMEPSYICRPRAPDMELEVGVTKDFANYFPHGAYDHVNGIADCERNVCYVFIESCIGRSNRDWELDLFEDCFHCFHKLIERRGTHDILDCKWGIHPLVRAFCAEISRVSVHELLHLCGCCEEELKGIDYDPHPHGCKKFQPEDISHVVLSNLFSQNRG